MVVVSMDRSSERRQLPPGIPVIDLSLDRSVISQLMVKTCEEFGFFKVINHCVPTDVSAQLQAEGEEFFNLPVAEKQLAGPPNPLGYGFRSIGLNGDIGDVEYLLLPADLSNQNAAVFPSPNRLSCCLHSCICSLSRRRSSQNLISGDLLREEKNI